VKYRNPNPRRLASADAVEQYRPDPRDAARAVQAALDAWLGADRPRIVCLCGSTRFYDAFQQANYDLTMAGAIVLSVGFYPHAKAEHGHGEGVGHDSAEKVALDDLHKRKIDLADEVVVVSDGSGYFGQSTRSEVAYATTLGKPVSYLEPAAGVSA
jgi:ferredoxin-NADP reductase